MIIEEYDQSLFISRFEDYKRVITPNNPNGNFSYKGLRALFDYLKEGYTEEDPYKLDVIALCCEYAEYKNFKELYVDNTGLFDELDDLKEEYNEDETKGNLTFPDWLFENHENDIRECITNNTPLIELGEDLNDGFIIGEY